VDSLDDSVARSGSGASALILAKLNINWCNAAADCAEVPPVASRGVGGAAVLRLPAPTQLLPSSLEPKALLNAVHIQNESPC
jgi:hypothetical protein